MFARRQAPVSLVAAPHRELPNGSNTMGVAGCKPELGAKRVENNDKAIQKWVPFTSKCSQKRWRLGLRPRPLIARESGRAPSALASLTQKIENGVFLHFSKIDSIHSQLLPSPKSSGGWGSAPDPPIAKESTFGPCQFDTPSYK